MARIEAGSGVLVAIIDLVQEMRGRSGIDNGKEMFPMTLHKEAKTFGMPWEGQYGYVQAVKVDDMIDLSGQLSHDDHGNIIGAAPLDDSGNIRDHSNMEIQMRQSYANAKKRFSATSVPPFRKVLEEVLYVTNIEKHSLLLARSARKLKWTAL